MSLLALPLPLNGLVVTLSHLACLLVAHYLQLLREFLFHLPAVGEGCQLD